jgi:acylphosphatase
MSSASRNQHVLDEFLVLQSMYGDDCVIHTPDAFLAASLSSLSSSSSSSSSSAAAGEAPDTSVEATFHLTLSDGIPLEVHVSYSLSAEVVPPLVKVTADTLSRGDADAVNAHARAFVAACVGAAGNDVEQQHIVSTLEWLQQQDKVSLNLVGADAAIAKCKNRDETVVHFLRVFIWFHHIYSEHKRDSIFDVAKENDLSGVVMPGKPGMIVVEGLQENVNDFVTRIRKLSWQKMSVKVEQLILLDPLGNRSADAKEATNGCADHDIVMGRLRKLPKPLQDLSANSKDVWGAHSNISLLVQIMKAAGLTEELKTALGMSLS